jgi:hypothetical protein
VSPSGILCEELARLGLAYVSASVMDSVLINAGLTLSGGAKQAVESHLETLQRLSHTDISNTDCITPRTL